MSESMRKRTYGECDFTVVTDNGSIVEHVCSLALSSHSASHWIENQEPDGSTSITFSWTEQPGWNKLPFELKNAKQMADFIFSWLEAGGKKLYSADPGSFDGHDEQGLLLTNHTNQHEPDRRVGAGRSFYYVIVAKPEWIYHGK